MTHLQDILYVEDDADIQAICKMVLESVGGFSVIACDSGRQALKTLQEKKFDLILLDVMMPGMDGPTTLTELRKLPNGKETPVIFITAKVQKSEIDAYTSMGVAGIISKPFDPMTLANTIRELWAKSAIGD